MTRTIRIKSQRKIIIDDLDKEYHAIQIKCYDGGHWYSEKEFSSKEEALQYLEKTAKEHLEKNITFKDRKLVSIKELEVAKEKGGGRSNW